MSVDDYTSPAIPRYRLNTQLTDRERLYLMLQISGVSWFRASPLLGVSPRGVQSIDLRLRRRLGAPTLVQAAILAILREEIDWHTVTNLIQQAGFGPHGGIT